MMNKKDNIPSRLTHEFFYFILQCSLPVSPCVVCRLDPGRDKILYKGHRKVDLGLKVVQVNCIIICFNHVYNFDIDLLMNTFCVTNQSHALTPASISDHEEKI